LPEPDLDVETVHGERLSSAQDDRVIEATSQEQRCLVTLDLEFGSSLIYGAGSCYGIAVLRLPPKPSYGHVEIAAKTLIEGISSRIERTLWSPDASNPHDPNEGCTHAA